MGLHDFASEHRLPAFARHRALHPAVRPPGPDAEHPAARRPGRCCSARRSPPPRSARGSRAALLTGEYSHTNGMLGLAHRGYRLADYDHHLVHTLRTAGLHLDADRRAAPVGRPARSIGYDRVVEIDSHARRARRAGDRGASCATRRRSRSSSRSASSRPTATTSSRPRCATRSTRCRPPTSPTRRETRRDMAAFKASARSLDQGVGAVLNALDEAELAENTLVILTTDHGLAFPGAKATLTDRGHRRDADHARARRLPRRPGLRRARLPDRPLPDDLRAGGHRAPGRGCRAARCSRCCARRPTRSTTRCLRRSPSTPPTSRSARCARGATSTSGASRTATRDRCSPNIDDSPSKDLLLAHGLAERADARGGALRPRLRSQRGRTTSPPTPRTRTSSPSCASGWTRWMEETDDPLLHGPVEPAPGDGDQPPAQRSPSDPTYVVQRS